MGDSPDLHPQLIDEAEGKGARHGRPASPVRGTVGVQHCIFKQLEQRSGTYSAGAQTLGFHLPGAGVRGETFDVPVADRYVAVVFAPQAGRHEAIAAESSVRILVELVCGNGRRLGAAPGPRGVARIHYALIPSLEI